MIIAENRFLFSISIKRHEISNTRKSRAELTRGISTSYMQKWGMAWIEWNICENKLLWLNGKVEDDKFGSWTTWAFSEIFSAILVVNSWEEFLSKNKKEALLSFLSTKKIKKYFNHLKHLTHQTFQLKTMSTTIPQCMQLLCLSFSLCLKKN